MRKGTRESESRVVPLYAELEWTESSLLPHEAGQARNPKQKNSSRVRCLGCSRWS